MLNLGFAPKSVEPKSAPSVRTRTRRHPIAATQFLWAQSLPGIPYRSCLEKLALHSTVYLPMSGDTAATDRSAARKPATSTDRNPMRKIFALVGIAIIVFMVFTAFSVQTAVKGRAKLSAIKDLYFPVLERVDADIVRVDKMEELYIQVVVLGDRDALDTANEQASKADEAFKEIAHLYPERAQEVTKLRALLTNYRTLAATVSVGYLKQQTGLEGATAQMNQALSDLRTSVKAFRQSSYDNFVKTLTDSQQAARLGPAVGHRAGRDEPVLHGRAGVLHPQQHEDDVGDCRAERNP